MTEYDVIIVGAGPAGSVTAGQVASQGLRTLIIERRREVGVPVQCGEFLPTPREMASMFPKCPRLQSISRVPSDITTYPTSEMILFSPRFDEYHFPLEANVIDRALFDKHLAAKAVDSGAELLLGTRVVAKTADNRVFARTKTGIKEFRARVVIGADGPHSIIARSLGFSYPDAKSDISQSLQYVIEDIREPIVEPMMFFGHQVAPGGYAWVIPKSRHSANVGFGLRRSYMDSGKSLGAYLQHLVRNKNILGGCLKDGKIIARVGASIPVGGPLKRTFSDNTMLVGDAAGHVMASNGGGIPTALAAGSIAGEVTIAHLENGSPLSMYESAWKQEFGAQLYASLAILRVADLMMMSDSLTDVAMRITGSRYLEDVIKCRLPRPLSFLTPLLRRIMEYL